MMTSVPPTSTASPAAQQPPVKPPTNPDAKAQTAAREFESVFLGQMTKIMMETVEQGDLSGGHGEEMFRGVLAEDLGREMAKGRGIGLASTVMDEIIRLQNAQSTGDAP